MTDPIGGLKPCNSKARSGLLTFAYGIFSAMIPIVADYLVQLVLQKRNSLESSKNPKVNTDLSVEQTPGIDGSLSTKVSNQGTS